MPTINHIISIEDTNIQKIYFYREGIFYKAYERSAYAFVTHCRDFKVKRRYYKAVNCEVVSIGFPSACLGKYFPKDKVQEIQEGVEIELDNMLDVESYEEWKSTISHDNSKMNGNLSDAEVAMKIKNFPIEVKTPLDCMLFLSELKTLL